MQLAGATSFVQQHFTDGLVVVIGSGLSAAEGMPGMGQLAGELDRQSSKLKGDDRRRWEEISKDLATGSGLEAALLAHQPSETLDDWIRQRTCDYLLPYERKIISETVRGTRELRLTVWLRAIRVPDAGLPIITPNYDRLIEVGCEMHGVHCDTTAIGHYAGQFDAQRSLLGACKGLTRGPRPRLEYFPRASILKPHGSFDWYRGKSQPFRSSFDLDCDRVIITPGLNKYKAGYQTPFDMHREIGNKHVDAAARLLIVGFGFNDDHLQVHLENRIRAGVHTLILSHSASPRVQQIVRDSPSCVCIVARTDKEPGAEISSNKGTSTVDDRELWDLGVLTRELLT